MTQRGRPPPPPARPPPPPPTRPGLPPELRDGAEKPPPPDRPGLPPELRDGAECDGEPREGEAPQLPPAPDDREGEAPQPPLPPPPPGDEARPGRWPGELMWYSVAGRGADVAGNVPSDREGAGPSARPGAPLGAFANVDPTGA